MSFIYDAGVFVAAERNDRHVWADHRARLELGLIPRTTAPVVARVSRSPRQVQLRRMLRGCDIVGLAPDDSHEVGALVGKASTADVVDAHLAIVAARRQATVLTSDVEDLRHLAVSGSPDRCERVTVPAMAATEVGTSSGRMALTNRDLRALPSG